MSINFSFAQSNCSLKKITAISCPPNKTNCDITLDNNYRAKKTNPIIGSLFEYCIKVPKTTLIQAPSTVTPETATIPASELQIEQQAATPTTVSPINQSEPTHTPISTEVEITTAPVKPIEEMPRPKKEINCKKRRITGVSNCMNRTVCDAWLEDGNYIKHKYPVYIGDVIDSCEVVDG